MDSMVQTAIESLVEQKAQAGQMFTAYDITQAVRQQVGRGVDVPHNSVRDEVHALYGDMSSNYSYTRSFIRLTNGQEAWLYHPVTDDPYTYPLAAQPATPVAQTTVGGSAVAQPTSPIAQPAAPIAQPASPLSSGSGVGTATLPTSSSQPTTTTISRRSNRGRNPSSVPVDRFGRIRVPAQVLRDAGYRPNDRIYAVLGAGSVSFVAIPPAGTKARKYVVDQYNNIRVHLHGKYTSKTFSMSTTGNIITALPL